MQCRPPKDEARCDKNGVIDNGTLEWYTADVKQCPKLLFSLMLSLMADNPPLGTTKTPELKIFAHELDCCGSADRGAPGAQLAALPIR